VDFGRSGFTYVPLLPAASSQVSSDQSKVVIQEGQSDSGFRLLTVQPNESSAAPSSVIGSGSLKSVTISALSGILSSEQKKKTLIVLDDLSVIEGVYGSTEAIMFLRTCKAVMANTEQEVR
jgi:hypothetical protein